MALFDVAGIIEAPYSHAERAQQLHYREQHLHEEEDIYQCENYNIYVKSTISM